MSKFRILFFAFLSVMLGLTSGCGSKTKLNKGEKVIITYSGPVDPRSQPTMDRLFRIFEEKHPNIQVKTIYTGGSDCVTKPQTMIASGTAPDIMWIWDMYFLEFANKGAFVNLEPFIAKDKQFDLTDFYPESVFRHNGKIIGFDLPATCFVLYYNKSLFDEAKVEYPNHRWDWDTVLKAAKALTKVNNNGRIEQYGFLMDTWVDRIEVLIAQNNGSVFNERYTECLINSPESMEAIQWVIDLWAKHRVSPTPMMVRERGFGELFKTSKVAMFMEGSWWAIDFKNIKSFEWDVAPLFKGKREYNLYNASPMGISNQCKHMEEAWELLKFLVGPEVQQEIAKRDCWLPTLKSLVERPTLNDLLYEATSSKNFAYALLDSIKYAHPRPIFPGYQDIRDRIIVPNLQLAYVEEKSVKEVCDTIKREVDRLLIKE